MRKIDTKICLICKIDAETGHRRGSQTNACLHWHHDPESGAIWTFCVGRCQRGYSIYQYVKEAGLKLNEFLKGDFDFKEAVPNEVTKMDWPASFIPLSDPKAQPGIDYLTERGIDAGDGMYYDTWRNGIVFPYYYDNIYCGAQIRLIKPWIDESGTARKVDTIPGTRLGLLFYGWNQSRFITDIRGVIITEGAFNAIAIQQAFNKAYGGVLRSPWKVIASSGTGVSAHKIEVLRDLKNEGLTIVLAPDFDEAGLKMLSKCKLEKAITHYALTGVRGVDWNDMSLALKEDEFIDRFMRSIDSV